MLSYPLSDTITVANLIDREKPYRVIKQVNNLFVKFIELYQENIENVKLGYLTLFGEHNEPKKLVLNELSVKNPY